MTITLKEWRQNALGALVAALILGTITGVSAWIEWHNQQVEKRSFLRALPVFEETTNAAVQAPDRLVTKTLSVPPAKRKALGAKIITIRSENWRGQTIVAFYKHAAIDNCTAYIYSPLSWRELAGWPGPCPRSNIGTILPLAKNWYKVNAGVNDGCLSHEFDGLYFQDLPSSWPAANFVGFGALTFVLSLVGVTIQSVRDKRQCPSAPPEEI